MLARESQPSHANSTDELDTVKIVSVWNQNNKSESLL